MDKYVKQFYSFGPMISLIHPSRSRPERSAATIKKWIERSGVYATELEIIYCLDIDDPLKDAYDYYNKGVSMDPQHPIETKVITNNCNAVQAINTGAKFANGNILIVVSDDTDCEQDWAKSLLIVMQEYTDWILKTQDGIQDWVITMPIMDRAYFKRSGYIYHPSYEHSFCDTELTCVAELTGRLMVAHMTFTHLHHSNGHCEKDEVSLKADTTFESGRRTFIDRLKINFNLQNPPGKLSDNVYTRMR